MLGDISTVREIYIACGYTDMRMQIDGLAAMVETRFGINPQGSKLFLFCGKRRDRMKALLWEEDGFLLMYKRLDNGVFQWPRSESELKPLTIQQFRWLMEGLKIEQKVSIKPGKIGSIC